MATRNTLALILAALILPDLRDSAGVAVDSFILLRIAFGILGLASTAFGILGFLVSITSPLAVSLRDSLVLAAWIQVTLVTLLQIAIGLLLIFRNTWLCTMLLGAPPNSARLLSSQQEP